MSTKGGQNKDKGKGKQTKVAWGGHGDDDLFTQQEERERKRLIENERKLTSEQLLQVAVLLDFWNETIGTRDDVARIALFKFFEGRENYENYKNAKEAVDPEGWVDKFQSKTTRTLPVEPREMIIIRLLANIHSGNKEGIECLNFLMNILEKESRTPTKIPKKISDEFSVYAEQYKSHMEEIEQVKSEFLARQSATAGAVLRMKQDSSRPKGVRKQEAGRSAEDLLKEQSLREERERAERERKKMAEQGRKSRKQDEAEKHEEKSRGERRELSREESREMPSTTKTSPAPSPMPSGRNGSPPSRSR